MALTAGAVLLRWIGLLVEVVHEIHPANVRPSFGGGGDVLSPLGFSQCNAGRAGMSPTNIVAAVEPLED